MRLKTRLILVVLLVSWIPLGVVSGVLSWRTEAKFQEDYQTQQEDLLRVVSAEIHRTVSRIDKVLASVAGSTTLKEELLQPLERGVFYGDGARERRVLQQARHARRRRQRRPSAPVLLDERGRCRGRTGAEAR